MDRIDRNLAKSNRIVGHFSGIESEQTLNRIGSNRWLQKSMLHEIGMKHLIYTFLTHVSCEFESFESDRRVFEWDWIGSNRIAELFLRIVTESNWNQ